MADTDREQDRRRERGVGAPTREEKERMYDMPAEFVDEWFERHSDLPENVQRELWKEEQITRRLADGQDYQKRGRLEGKIVDVQTIGDKTTVAVADGNTFTVAEVDSAQAQGLKRGDAVTVQQEKDTEIARTKQAEPTKSKGLER